MARKSQTTQKKNGQEVCISKPQKNNFGKVKQTSKLMTKFIYSHEVQIKETMRLVVWILVDSFIPDSHTP